VSRKEGRESGREEERGVRGGAMPPYILA